MRQTCLLLVIIFLFFLSACDLINENNVEATPSPPTDSGTPEPFQGNNQNDSPAVVSTPAIGTTITETETAPSLTIWVPPNTVLETEGGTAVMANALLDFNAKYPELETRVEQKQVSGQGGILNYLRTGANVAPGILPDLIALPTSQLATASDGLIYPLDDLIDTALLDDLYPAARSMVTIDEEIFGFPFAITNLTHLVYQTSVITTTPPLLWSELRNSINSPFIFPAAGAEGASLVLQFYLAEGGQLTNEAGQPALQAPPLSMALQHFNLARTSGFILLQSSNVDTLDESWQIFQEGTAVYALTNADQFLSQRTPDSTIGYGVIPGPAGPLTPLINGWAWAVSTADPTRRTLAAELLSLFIAEQNLGPWSMQSNRIPASRNAFNAWPTGDAYVNFLQLELERAQPNPINPSSQIMAALRNAVFDVVSLAQTPQEAAGEAVTAVQP